MRRILIPVLDYQYLLGTIFWQFFLGFAAGRALIYGFNPFSSAYAAFSVVLKGRLSWPAVLGVFFGSRNLTNACTGMAVVIVILLTERWLQEKPSFPQELVQASLVGATHFVVKAAASLLQGIETAFAGIFCESFLAVVIFTLFIFSMKLKEEKEQKTLLYSLILVMIVCGYGDLQVAAITIRDLMIFLVILGAAFYGGPGGGACAGVILGLLCSGDYYAVLPASGLYAVTGFLSGFFKSLGRYLIVISFLFAHLFFSLFFRDSAILYSHLQTVLLAGGIFFLAQPFLDKIVKNERPSLLIALQAEVGFSQRPKASESISGDALAVKRPDHESLLLLLSDGMGAGIQAAKVSRTVISVLEGLLENNVSLEVAASAANNALFFQNNEENVATIDLVKIDFRRGFADFLKAGAAPSYIKSRNTVEMIRSSCWPAGCLQELDLNVLRRPVSAGDLLVVASDGVTEIDEQAQEPGNWLYNYLKDLSLEEPQTVADLIIKNALLAEDSRNRDDMTVIVVAFRSS